MTGSNLPVAPDEVAVPISVLGADLIDRGGVNSNVLEVLRKALPSFAGRGNTGNSNGTNNNQNTAGGSQVQLRNLQDRPLPTKVSVFIPELMTAPSEQEVTLRPRAVNELPLTAVLDGAVLTQRGDRPVQVQVSASYQSKRLVRSFTELIGVT